MTEHPNIAAARANFNPYADRGQPVDVRLANRYVESDDGCWIWLSTVNSTGYGMMKVEGVHRVAHRVAYEVLVGPVPEGLVLDHLCMVKACVNPSHLEPVTQAENVRRCNESLGIKQYATHCRNGHAFVGSSAGRGYRRCPVCTSEINRRRYLRKKEASNA